MFATIASNALGDPDVDAVSVSASASSTIAAKSFSLREEGMTTRATGRRPLCVLLLLKPSRAAAIEALCADAMLEGEGSVRFVQQGHGQEADVVLQKASDYMVTVGGRCEYRDEFLTEIQ